MNDLPYIPLDEELSLNLGILTIVLKTLGENKNGSAVLDINKIQIFMYLLKNPSKIEKTMIVAGKSKPNISLRDTYTIKGLSLNVDILFNTYKIKTLFKHMAARNYIIASKKDNTSPTLITLSEEGNIFYESLTGEYFTSLIETSKVLNPLKSNTTSKLNKILNEVFKESE